jgi:hypothetical protein
MKIQQDSKGKGRENVPVTRDPESRELENASMSAVVYCYTSALRRTSTLSAPLVIGGMKDDVSSPDGLKVLNDHWMGDKLFCLRKGQCHSFAAVKCRHT